MTKVDTSFLAELKASGRLPSPTGVALTILELTRKPDTSTEDLVEVLRGDPSLAGQVLKYANSAEMGTRTEITSLNDALVRLGMSMVRQLCLGFSVLSNARSGPCPRFDYQRYWARSLATAVSCQVLSRRISSVSPDEGFTCGLLGHIGSLALASVYPDEYSRILDTWNAGSNAELRKLEQDTLSIDHHQVGAAIFKDWGLPEFYQQAVLNQDDLEWIGGPSHAPERGRPEKLANLLNIADLAAEICLEDGPERHRLVLDFVHVGEAHLIPEEQWIGLYDEILAEWSRMGRVLDILTSNVPAMENLVRRARAYDQPLKDKPRAGNGVIPEDEPGDGAAPGADPESGLEILLVTDSLVDRRLLEKKLGAAGHKVITAVHGREALELALQTNPQLILTDWMLPEMDGLELCRTLRRSEQMGNCHILIMTSNSSQQELEEGFEAGIDDYLIKPLNHRILAAKVRSAARVIHLQVVSDRDRKAIQRHLKTMALQKRELQKMYEKVERLAMEDQLTGLPNRRAGLDRLEQVWAEASRTRHPMLVMVIDIDKFKVVNDTYGHDAGDAVLRSTAGMMRNTLREYDVVCRFGGEEFLVICPGADIQIAMALGDRIRSAVENNHMSTPEFEGHVTISIGVSVRGDEHANPQDMIKEADEALYAAKNAGRNKVCIA